MRPAARPALARPQRPASRSDCGTVVKQFIRWYLRRPGATLPERPAVALWRARKDQEE